MKIILVFDNKEIELLDQQAQFTEGEQVTIVEGGKHDVLRVESLHKTVFIVGNSADLGYKVILK